MNKDKLIKKIQGLLNLADPARGATPKEAAAAMAKAQELMTAHGLESVEVESGREREIGHESVVMDYEVAHDYDLNLSHVLSWCFGVRVIFGRQRLGARSYHTFILVGEPMDVALAKIAIPILASAMDSHPDSYPLALCRSFYAGVERGYLEASEQGRLRAQAIASRTAVTRYAMVLVDKDKSITSYMDKTFKLGKEIPEDKTPINLHAYMEGFERGRELDLSAEPRLSAPAQEVAPRPSRRPATSYEEFERELLRRMAEFNRKMGM